MACRSTYYKGPTCYKRAIKLEGRASKPSRAEKESTQYGEQYIDIHYPDHFIKARIIVMHHHRLYHIYTLSPRGHGKTLHIYFNVTEIYHK